MSQIFQSGGSGSGTVGPGTVNKIAKFTPSTTTIGDSQISDDGTNVVVGTGTQTFFSNADQIFQIGKLTTSIGTAFADFIKIGATTTVTVQPSAATNSSLGITLYTAQGFNLDINNSFALNGGLVIGGSLATGEVTSALGAFGQVSVNSTGSSVDGITGLLCTSAHNGIDIGSGAGCAVSLVIGGDFCALSDGSNGATVRGSLTTMIGGRFTSLISGITPTTAIAARIDEPVCFDGGAGVGVPAEPTNKTAVDLRGTLSIKRSDVASASSITDMSVGTSWIKITGSTVTSLHGIHADSFEKKITIYNASSAIVTIKHQSASATAARRIICPLSLDFDLNAGESVDLEYDANQSRWIALSMPLSIRSTLGDLEIYNNGAKTGWFTTTNELIVGTSAPFVDATINATRSVNVDGTLAAGFGSLEDVSTTTNGSGDYYGIILAPLPNGSNNLNSVIGAYFSVLSSTSGTGGTLKGADFLVLNSGGGSIDNAYAAYMTLNEGTCNVDAITCYVEQPTGSLGAHQALSVNGHWGVEEKEDSSTTGNVNSYSCESSNIYFTNASGPVIRGLTNYRTGKRILLVFKNGGTVANEHASATASERISTNTGADIVIVGLGSVEIVYSAVRSRWIVISSSL